MLRKKRGQKTLNVLKLTDKIGFLKINSEVSGIKLTETERSQGETTRFERKKQQTKQCRIFFFFPKSTMGVRGNVKGCHSANEQNGSSTSYTCVVSLSLEFVDFFLPFQQLLSANIQLFSQHSKLLLMGHITWVKK